MVALTIQKCRAKRVEEQTQRRCISAGEYNTEDVGWSESPSGRASPVHVGIRRDLREEGISTGKSSWLC